MEVPLFLLVFFSSLGVLLFLYALHFRRRALTMGAERLRSALSRAIDGEEGAPGLDLEEAARELEGRFGRAALISLVLCGLDLGGCLILTFISALPGLALPMCGFAVLLLSSALSLQVLRELPRALLEDRESSDT
ncbi:MAG: hypothetical protein ACUVRX_10245 [Actinomycetota bacterium]